METLTTFLLRVRAWREKGRRRRGAGRQRPAARAAPAGHPFRARGSRRARPARAAPPPPPPPLRLQEQANGSLDPELAVVLSSIATACKQIASLVNRSGISNLTGLAGAANIQGEDQKKLDVISNEVFCNALRASGRTGVIASEEEDLPVAVEETYSGNYVVVFDPLDGSSNIDAGIATGSIFGIYAPSDECSIEDMDDPTKMMEVGGREGGGEGGGAGESARGQERRPPFVPSSPPKNCVVNVCQPGDALLAAGYCLYSSSVNFVLTVGRGVWGFT